MQDFAAVRRQMVKDHIYARGVRDPAVLAAMSEVAREHFVPKALRAHAYDDKPLPIAENQTISQPYIVAFMVEALALERGQRVLEIGAGSGYAAAVLAATGVEVFAVERVEALIATADENLARAGYGRVTVIHGDGTQGWAREAPFDAILVSAGGASIPEALTEQLKIGGRLVIPVGGRRGQKLARVIRTSEWVFDRENIAQVFFVPLISS